MSRHQVDVGDVVDDRLAAGRDRAGGRWGCSSRRRRSGSCRLGRRAGSRRGSSPGRGPDCPGLREGIFDGVGHPEPPRSSKAMLSGLWMSGSAATSWISNPVAPGSPCVPRCGKHKETTTRFPTGAKDLGVDISRQDPSETATSGQGRTTRGNPLADLPEAFLQNGQRVGRECLGREFIQVSETARFSASQRRSQRRRDSLAQVNPGEQGQNFPRGSRSLSSRIPPSLRLSIGMLTWTPRLRCT